MAQTAGRRQGVQMNSRELVQAITDSDIRIRRSKYLPHCSSLSNRGDSSSGGTNKQNGKYLDDEEFRKKVEETLNDFIGRKCVIEEVLIRIRDNPKKGYATRVTMEGRQEIEVSEFLTGKFCKDNKISRFALMTGDKRNWISCEVNEKGVRCYKVQNGPPVMLNINWCVGERNCSLEIELGTRNHVKLIKHNDELTDEDLIANKEVRINGKTLLETFPWSFPASNDETPTIRVSKQNKKYLYDEELRKKVKALLNNYVGKSCTLEKLLVKIRDNPKKGYATRFTIKGCQEIKVSQLLAGSFCKDNNITRLALLTDDQKNGLSCEVNESGVRCYKVQNGPPVILTINWYNREKKCTLEVELGPESYLKVIKQSKNLDEEDLSANEEVKINGEFLAEALQGLSKPFGEEIVIESMQELSNTERKGEESVKQIKSVVPGNVNK